MLDSFGQRESDLGVVELFDLGPATVASLDDLHFDDLDRVGAGAMASSHVAVAQRYRTAHGEITVFSVHVVSTRSRVVSQPDTKVLDLVWGLLRYLQKEKK